MSEYSDNVESIVRGAFGFFELRNNSLTFEETLDMHCQAAIDNFSRVLREEGHAQHTPFDQLGDHAWEAGFYASIAEDILRGDVSRPSVGHVRTHALNLSRSLLVA